MQLSPACDLECHTGPEPSWPKGRSNMDMVKTCFFQDLCGLDLTRLWAFPLRTNFPESACLRPFCLTSWTQTFLGTCFLWFVFFCRFKMLFGYLFDVGPSRPEQQYLRKRALCILRHLFQLVEQPIDRHLCRQGPLRVVRGKERGIAYDIGGSVSIM